MVCLRPWACVERCLRGLHQCMLLRHEDAADELAGHVEVPHRAPVIAARQAVCQAWPCGWRLYAARHIRVGGGCGIAGLFGADVGITSEWSRRDNDVIREGR